MLDLTKMPSVKLVAVDIDGTLLNSSFRVSEGNIRALGDAHRAGIHVVIATGRRHAFAIPIAEMLGFSPHIISSNGAITRDAAGRLMAKTLMPRTIARAVLDHMQPWNSSAVLTFDREDKGSIVVQSRAHLSAHIARWIDSNTEYILEVDPLADSLTEDPIQTMYCGQVSEMSKAIEHLRQGSIVNDVSHHITQYDQRDLCIFDVLPRGCTKGHALAQLCTALGIASKDVLAVGDNYNDREMLEFCGYPFVVSNAHDDLKEQGWTVTGSNDDDGVAKAIASILEPAERS